MSRYVGPSWKISRRLGYSILENGKELSKRPYAPGQHGKDKKVKLSEYGKQLAEKQKLRKSYGVSEKQFRRFFIIAKKDPTITGLAFLRILESRLDNMVFRMGFARTRRQARQLVTHGHIHVNGKKVDIPSYLLNVGDVVTLTDPSKKFTIVNEALSLVKSTVPYVSLDKEKFEGKFERLPERSELSKDINEAQVVEYYNRQL